MIGIKSTGNHKRTTNFLKDLLLRKHFSALDRYGRMGVDVLSRATPVDTGLSSLSWDYRIIKNPPGIEWHNTNTVNGTPVVILIQYGHGTGTGGYVAGRDFINPAIKPVFDQIVNDIWKVVIS